MAPDRAPDEAVAASRSRRARRCATTLIAELREARVVAQRVEIGRPREYVSRSRRSRSDRLAQLLEGGVRVAGQRLEARGVVRAAPVVGLALERLRSSLRGRAASSPSAQVARTRGRSPPSRAACTPRPAFAPTTSTRVPSSTAIAPRNRRSARARASPAGMSIALVAEREARAPRTTTYSSSWPSLSRRARSITLVARLAPDPDVDPGRPEADAPPQRASMSSRRTTRTGRARRARRSRNRSLAARSSSRTTGSIASTPSTRSSRFSVPAQSPSASSRSPS